MFIAHSEPVEKRRYSRFVSCPKSVVGEIIPASGRIRADGGGTDVPYCFQRCFVKADLAVNRRVGCNREIFRGPVTCLAVICSSDSFDYLTYSPVDHRFVLIGIVPYRSLHRDFIRDHVADHRVVRVDAADGDDGGIGGSDVSAYDGLQGLNDRCSCDDRIGISLGDPAVAALAEDLNIDGVEPGHDRAGEDGDRPGWYFGRIVETETCFHLGVLQRSVGDHGYGSDVLFLRRLEDEFHASPYLVSHVREEDRGAQQGRDMGVVSAGVHRTFIQRGEGAGGLFLYGKSVDVRAQSDAGPVFRSAEKTDRAGLHTGIDQPDPKIFQYRADILCGPVLMGACFGVLV